jgi:DNA-directed RNA polymerase specialized sigma24 family protein
MTHEMFIRVYRGLPGFRGEADLATWVYRIARKAWNLHLKLEAAVTPCGSESKSIQF